MKFEERVQLNEDKLNDTDDQIVDYIRENRAGIGDISIQAMAEALYTVHQLNRYGLRKSDHKRVPSRHPGFFVISGGIRPPFRPGSGS